MRPLTPATTLAALAALTTPALAAPVVMEASGTVYLFNPSFEGADALPFLGFTEGDSWSVRLEYDTTTLPSSQFGNITTYSFTGTNSTWRMGANTVDIETVEISLLSTSNTGITSFRFFLADGVTSGGIDFSSLDAIPSTVPVDTSSLRTFGAEFFADSSDNQLLLPIALGDVDAVSVVPAPAAVLLASAMGLTGLRRRRG